MNVTVYTAGLACKACTMTKLHLERRGIAYTEVPINTNTTVMELIEYCNFSQAPVVCVESESAERQAWDGYRPDRIDGLVA